MDRKFVLIAACMAGLSGTLFAQDAPKEDAVRGFKAYTHHLCDTCHGSLGQGGERGAGPKIAPGVWPDSAFAQQVRKPRQAMIPYSEKTLQTQDLTDIYAYLLTIKPPPPAKEIPLLRDF